MLKILVRSEKIYSVHWQAAGPTSSAKNQKNGAKYDRVSMDEARAVVQAKLQNVVIKLARANLLEARRVNLD